MGRLAMLAAATPTCKAGWAEKARSTANAGSPSASRRAPLNQGSSKAENRPLQLETGAGRVSPALRASEPPARPRPAPRDDAAQGFNPRQGGNLRRRSAAVSLPITGFMPSPILRMSCSTNIGRAAYRPPVRNRDRSYWLCPVSPHHFTHYRIHARSPAFAGLRLLIRQRRPGPRPCRAWSQALIARPSACATAIF